MYRKQCFPGRSVMNLKSTCLAALLFWVLSSPALAINKCTGADGKVAYQDTPCAGGAKSSQEVKVYDNSIGTSGGNWRFESKKDALTGASRSAKVLNPYGNWR